MNVTYRRRNGSLCAWTSYSSSLPGRRAPGTCSSSCVTGSPAPGPIWRPSPGRRGRRSPRASTCSWPPGSSRPPARPRSTGGRPPATFAFNPAARVVLAVDLGATHARLAADRPRRAPPGGARRAARDRGRAGPRARPRGRAGPRAARAPPGGRSATSPASASACPAPSSTPPGDPINPPIMPGWDDADVPGHLVPRASTRPGARGQRRQHHGPRRAPSQWPGRGPPAVRQGRHRHRRRHHRRRRSSAAARRAPRATSATSPSRAAPTCRAAAATSAAWRPSPAGRPSPNARWRDATTSADVVALVRAGDVDASRAVRAGRPATSARCSPRA